MKNPNLDIKLDPGNSSPLYVQLAQMLAEGIREGRFEADAALPSERALSESLSVSRVTARKAIDQLVDQGLIVRKRGSGNYVALRLEQPLSRLTSFSEELRQRGYTPHSRWLQRSISAALPDELLPLGLSPGARVARLERLRLAEEAVLSYEVSAIPQTVLPNPEAVDASLYEYLARSGNAPVRALQHIRTLNADMKLAERLELPVGAAVFFVTRIGYLASGQVVELTHSYCRSDCYDFVIEMRR
ncbi:GntR family transcriptional regulator [Verminephrobacter aporrectodeae subsp. tuberculatae]|uniref:GntR family transcriptional regulator n=1 Tax=Verminephrobacter aporrectodeae subsp. tuberculatae TaxID=1110392 RepID=A0ABT3KXG0_9BURK|nr:GntR family transcriptional regulator [Verminephrobacter aporrectodeae]MCW5322702.1 GntR family transcriptional regulator [Verminephrobacter aporrectodeae subsp. tuberculatae]